MKVLCLEVNNIYHMSPQLAEGCDSCLCFLYCNGPVGGIKGNIPVNVELWDASGDHQCVLIQEKCMPLDLTVLSFLYTYRYEGCWRAIMHEADGMTHDSHDSRFNQAFMSTCHSLCRRVAGVQSRRSRPGPTDWRLVRLLREEKQPHR